MPVYTRRGLRQTLGRGYIRDMVSSTTQTAANAAAAGAIFNNPRFIDPGLAGQGLYANANIWHLTGAYDYRVASFNAASGQYVTGQFIEATISVGDEFEVHSRLSATEKNNAIDETLKRLAFRQEVGLPTGTAGQDFFAIENAASPNYIVDVLDAYWFANPTGTLDRDLRRFDDIHLVTTATGREIRVAPAPGASAQLVLAAILTVTLGPTEAATVNLPDDDRWLLAGAAANCYNLMIQDTPGQNDAAMSIRRAEWSRIFTDLSAKRTPEYVRKVRLGEPEDATSLWGLPRW